MTMKHVFMLGVSAVVMTYAANAAADSPRLKGAYGFTGSDSCLVAPFGFKPNFQIVDDSAWSDSGHAEGIRTFNGDGTGTVKGTFMGITGPPTPGFPPGAGSSNFSFSFTYTVSEDSGWTTTNVPGTDTGTVLTGPRAGQTFTVQNNATSTGLISRNDNTLTLANLTPMVETITYSNGD